MSGGNAFWLPSTAGIILAVKAQPGARRTQIGPVLPAAEAPGWPPARLKISINAPPEDGKANDAIISALAKWLGIKPSAITLTAGGSSRDKKLAIIGPVTVPEVP
ncbi:MAG: DUF167 domain-containing protein [Acidocella sp.]|nr:DUF167 domain-containing protein [Acidocella sp.]